MRVSPVASDRHARYTKVLEAYQAQMTDVINDVTTGIRGKYLTEIPGQQMLYYRKLEQARAYLATPPLPVTPGTYGLLVAEIGITGSDVYQVAQVILNAANAWEVVSVVLEPARLIRIGEIRNAFFFEECDDAVAAFIIDVAAL